MRAIHFIPQEKDPEKGFNLTMSYVMFSRRLAKVWYFTQIAIHVSTEKHPGIYSSKNLRTRSIVGVDAKSEKGIQGVQHFSLPMEWIVNSPNSIQSLQNSLFGPGFLASSIYHTYITLRL